MATTTSSALHGSFNGDNARRILGNGIILCIILDTAFLRFGKLKVECNTK